MHINVTSIFQKKYATTMRTIIEYKVSKQGICFLKITDQVTIGTRNIVIHQNIKCMVGLQCHAKYD